jgi:phosphatidylglycerol:prolipoprotein diacylglycerol transferase
VHPIIFSIGPLTVYSFGVMLAIAFLVSGNVVQRELTRKGLDPELASTFLVWAAIGGLVGSRVLSFVDDWNGFVADPLAFVFTGAGFVFYGGLIGGFLTVSAVIWRRGLPSWKVTDCIAPALAVGQAIGRIGCQLAGDGDWGMPSTLPWAMSYPNAIIGWEQWTKDSGLPIDVRVHPAPVYETILYALVFLVLWRRRLTPHADGYILWMYLLLSGAARFLVEIVRINPRFAFGLSEAQFISLAIMAIGAVQIWRSGGTVAPEASASASAPVGRRAS